MNRTSIGILVAVLLIAAVAWYFTAGKSGSMMQAGEQATAMQSMKELIAAGITQKCTFNEPQSKTLGTIYIADGKVRGDFSSQSAAGTMSGHMISDGTSVHTWMDGMNQGFTTSFSATQGSGENTGADSQKGLSPDMRTNYDCERWSKDASMFDLPSGVTFTDMSAMMQGGTTGEGNRGTMNPPSKSTQCNMCDQAPEPQRTQCRQALNCR